jgi:hypothetical protein
MNRKSWDLESAVKDLILHDLRCGYEAALTYPCCGVIRKDVRGCDDLVRFGMAR